MHKADHSVVANGASVPLGTVMHDLASVAVTPAFAAPTGNVAFTFYSNSTCEGSGTAAGSIALDGATPGVAHPSSATAALAPGSYAFKASWPGDTNYTGDASDCEPFTVSQGTSTVTTTLHKADHSVVANGASVPLGTVMHDLASVAVTPTFAAPTGNVAFTFYSNATCEGSGTAAGSIALDGATPGVAHPSSATAALGSGKLRLHGKLARRHQLHR